MGWAALILPYLDQRPLYDQIDFTTTIDTPVNQAIRTTVLPIYTCPSDSSTGVYLICNDSSSPLADVATNSYTACYGALGQIDAVPAQGNGLFGAKLELADPGCKRRHEQYTRPGGTPAMSAQAPWAGVVTNGAVVTTPGCPVFASVMEAAPTQVMARVGKRPLLDPTSEPYDFFSPHNDIVNFVFADGSVHALHSSVTIDVLSPRHHSRRRNGAERRFLTEAHPCENGLHLSHLTAGRVRWFCWSSWGPAAIHVPVPRVWKMVRFTGIAARDFDFPCRRGGSSGQAARCLRERY